MTRTPLYGCVGCGRVLYDLKWKAVLSHMHACCPERLEQKGYFYLRSRCQIGGPYCEVPGYSFTDSHNGERDPYSQHSDQDSYRHQDQHRSYYGSWDHHEERHSYYGPSDRLDEHIPSQRGNNAGYSHYGPSLADAQFRMSLPQASRQHMDYGTDDDTINDFPKGQESPVMIYNLASIALLMQAWTLASC
jgi:hypothetical protein